MSDWTALDDELARWRSAGRNASFWWRDDDAAQAGPELERLLGLAASSKTPVGIAAVPAILEDKAVRLIAVAPGATVLQHGHRHDNRAAPKAAKSEFPADLPLANRLADVEAGRARLAAIAGDRFRPVFVPPWNRMTDDMAPGLAAIGLKGLSRNKPRAARFAAPGLVEANIHVDVVDWHAERRFLGEARCIGAVVDHLAAKRLGQVDADEPTGILTHHLVQDETTWQFLEDFFRRLAGRFLPVPVVFGMP